MKKTLENGEGVLIGGLWKFCVEEKRKRGGAQISLAKENLIKNLDTID